MADESNIILAGSGDETGQIRIAPEVVEIMIGIAASQVDGVFSMSGSLATSFSELLGRSSLGKGVKLVQDDAGNLRADVYVTLAYGVSIPKTALEIQKRVKQQLLFMTGLEIQEVDVHVEGIMPERQPATVDPDNLFADEEEGTDGVK